MTKFATRVYGAELRMTSTTTTNMAGQTFRKGNMH
jgi:hypothetical protein